MKNPKGLRQRFITFLASVLGADTVVITKAEKQAFDQSVNVFEKPEQGFEMINQALSQKVTPENYESMVDAMLDVIRKKTNTKPDKEVLRIMEKEARLLIEKINQLKKKIATTEAIKTEVTRVRDMLLANIDPEFEVLTLESAKFVAEEINTESEDTTSAIEAVIEEKIGDTVEDLFEEAENTEESE